MKKSRLFVWCVVASSWLLACNLVSQPNPVLPTVTGNPISSPSQETPAATSTAAQPTSVFPTAIPISTEAADENPTPVSQPPVEPIISPENVAQITQLSVVPSAEFISSIAWSPDSQWMVIAANHSILFIDRAGSIDDSRTIEVTEQVINADFSPDGNVLGFKTISTDGSGKVQVNLWDLMANAPLTVWNDRFAGATAVGFSPDENTVAAGYADGSVTLWNSHEKIEIKNLSGGSTYGVAEIKFSADGKRLAAFSEVGELTIWDIESGAAQVFSAAGYVAGPIAYPLLRPDWQVFGWISRGSLNVISIPNEQARYQVSGRESAGGQAFSPDSRLLTFGSYDFKDGDQNLPYPYLNFYDAATGELIFTLNSLTDKSGVDAIGDIPGEVAFSPDGTRLAIAFGDRIELWHVAK